MITIVKQDFWSLHHFHRLCEVVAEPNVALVVRANKDRWEMWESECVRHGEREGKDDTTEIIERANKG